MKLLVSHWSHLTHTVSPLAGLHQSHRQGSMPSHLSQSKMRLMLLLLLTTIPIHLGLGLLK